MDYTNEERCLAVLKNVDSVLLSYIRDLEAHGLTSLNFGKMVATQVKHTIDVLEKAGIQDPTL